MTRGESVTFGAASGRLPYASKRRIPVIMAASGPKAIEVAGEVADGALLLVGFNRGIVETALGHLERGAKRAGRRLTALWLGQHGGAGGASQRVLLTGVERLAFTASSHGVLQVHLQLFEQGRTSAVLSAIRLRNLATEAQL